MRDNEKMIKTDDLIMREKLKVIFRVLLNNN